MRMLVLLAALTACGGKDDGAGSKREPSSDPKPMPGKPATDKPVKPAMRPVQAPGNTDKGTCKFTVGGALTGDYAAGAPPGAVMASYWLVDDTARKIVFKDGEQGLIINCGSGSAKLAFNARVTSKDELPYAPKKYELGKGKGPIHVIGTLPGASVPGGEGTFEITAFDPAHIAGAFAFKSELLGNKGIVDIAGTFDFRCPNTCK